MKIQSLIHTGLQGRKVSPGDVINVDAVTGAQWIAEGYAREPRKGPRREPVKPVPVARPVKEVQDGTDSRD